jgi:hypothetical protein
VYSPIIIKPPIIMGRFSDSIDEKPGETARNQSQATK